VVVPVTRMSGQLENLESWLSDLDSYTVQVVLVHDVRDQETGVELSNLVSKINNPAIELYEGKFGSAGATRNFGIEKCNGDWLSFWDSDDLPNVKAAVFACHLQPDSIDVIIGAYQIQQVILGNLISKPKQIGSYLEIANDPGLWRCIFKKKSIENLRFEHFLMAEDQVFLLQYDFSNRSVAFSQDVFYTYFVGNLTQATRNVESLRDLINSISLISSRIGNFSGNQSIIAWIMFLNQTLTGLKNLPRSGKKTLFLICIKTIGKYGIKNPLVLIKSTNLILRSKLKTR
jgi:hypothetical protein